MKVLVADDEFYARKALVKMLNDIGLEVEVAADVETGKEAVEFLAGNPDVDVVVTDIRMPEMDGLKLAEYVHREYPEIAVVIETGYADFKYARQAIQYSVRDYTTKPIGKENLKSALLNIEKSRQREEKKVKDRIQESVFEISKEQLSIQELAQNPELQEQFMGGCPEYAASLCYRVLLMQVDGETSYPQKEEIKRRLREEAGTQACEAFYFKNNREYVLLAYYEDASASLHSLKSCANSALAWSKAVTGCSASISLSRCHQGMGELYDAYKEAVYAISQRLLQGWDHVYVYNGERDSVPALSQQDEIGLQKALGNSDCRGAEQVICRIFEDPELLQNGDIYGLYRRIISVLSILNRHYHRSDSPSDDRVLLMFSRRYDLYNFKHMSELENYLLGMVREICCQAQGGMENSSDIIREITEYISRSYQYDISLQDLAEKKYFMNVSYLSRLFKANVGKTFSKYLIEYRLEKSRELLEQTILKVSDIATHVGYNDVSHYIQSFRKVYGMTPEEYRSSLGRTEA